jgi:PD-(D/E)XK nuclease superfamily
MIRRRPEDWAPPSAMPYGEYRVAHAEPRRPRRKNGVRDLDAITGAIVDASLHIHRDLGPGLLESVYETVLERALVRRGFCIERQKTIRFEYDGMAFEEGFRADLVVDHRTGGPASHCERRSALRVFAAPCEPTRGDEREWRPAHPYGPAEATWRPLSPVRETVTAAERPWSAVRTGSRPPGRRPHPSGRRSRADRESAPDRSRRARGPASWA